MCNITLCDFTSHLHHCPSCVATALHHRYKDCLKRVGHDGLHSSAAETALFDAEPNKVVAGR